MNEILKKIERLLWVGLGDYYPQNKQWKEFTWSPETEKVMLEGFERFKKEVMDLIEKEKVK